MTIRTASLEFTNQEFPEGTQAGKVRITATPDVGLATFVELDGSPTTATFDLLGGVTYTISAQRLDVVGNVLGPVVSVVFSEPLPVTVTVSVPSSITVA